MAIITATGVKKLISTSDTTLTILSGVDLKVNAGESIAILGVSGSGKTTLLSLLAGLDLPSSGDISVDGKHWGKMNEDTRAQYRLGNVGFIFQHFNLLAHCTALENVMLPLELAGISQPEAKAKTLLEKVGLSHRLQHYPSQLSGGEQQRTAIARAFVTNPKILFADEPTGFLDVKTGDKIIDLLFELNKLYQTTLVFVTHEQNLAARCQRTFLLEDGKLCGTN
jgi:putative ABC transport system ATP-binding protein